MPSLCRSLHRLCIESLSPRAAGGRPWRWNRRKDRICWAASSKDAPQVSPNRQGEATTDFTPFTLVTYSHDPDAVCQHAEEILVDATREHCFRIWNKWDNLADFLDLIGEVFSLFCHLTLYPFLFTRSSWKKTIPTRRSCSATTAMVRCSALWHSG